MSFGVGIFVIVISLIVFVLICILAFHICLKKDHPLLSIAMIIGFSIIGGVEIGFVGSCIQLKVTVIDKFTSGGTTYVVVEDDSGEMELFKEDEDWTSTKIGETIHITYRKLDEALDEQTTIIIYSKKEASK